MGMVVEEGLLMGELASKVDEDFSMREKASGEGGSSKAGVAKKANDGSDLCELKGSRSWARTGMSKSPLPIRGALLLLILLVLEARGDEAGFKRGITCVGRKPGYSADPGSQCHRWESNSSPMCRRSPR